MLAAWWPATSMQGISIGTFWHCAGKWSLLKKSDSGCGLGTQ
jgi:hypothetical protein